MHMHTYVLLVPIIYRLALVLLPVCVAFIIFVPVEIENYDRDYSCAEEGRFVLGASARSLL